LNLNRNFRDGWRNVDGARSLQSHRAIIEGQRNHLPVEASRSAAIELINLPPRFPLSARSARIAQRTAITGGIARARLKSVESDLDRISTGLPNPPLPAVARRARREIQLESDRSTIAQPARA